MSQNNPTAQGVNTALEATKLVEALSRAEQAEAALSEERKAMSDAAEAAVEALHNLIVLARPKFSDDVQELALELANNAKGDLSRFIVPAKPAVDPLVEVWAEAFPGDPQGTRERHVSMIRAAIERAGGTISFERKGE